MATFESFSIVRVLAKLLNNTTCYSSGDFAKSCSKEQRYKKFESDLQRKSVFAGIGNAEILADFLHEKVFYFRMSWYSRFPLCKRIHIHAMPASLSVKDAILAAEVT